MNTSIEATLSFLSSRMVGLIYPSSTDSYLCIVIELIPGSRRAYLLNSLFIPIIKKAGFASRPTKSNYFNSRNFSTEIFFFLRVTTSRTAAIVFSF